MKLSIYLAVVLMCLLGSFGADASPETLSERSFSVARLSGSFQGKSVTLGDIDGDGDLDILANSGSGPDYVFWINDLGCFTEQRFAFGQMPFSTLLLDFDQDGDLDIVAAVPGSDTVQTLEHLADGTFAPFEVIAQGGNPLSVAAMDLNGDQIDDVCASFSAEARVSLFFGQGEAGLGPEIQIEVPERTIDHVLHDIDGDSDNDIVLLNRLQVDFLLNDGSGQFALSPALVLPEEPSDLILGDLDGDMDLDMIVSFAGTYPDPGHVQVYLNDGSGGYSPSAQISAGDAPVGLELYDYDQDADLDLFISNERSHDVNVLKNIGEGTFELDHSAYFGSRIRSVQVRDLDGDSKPELLAQGMFDQFLDILTLQRDGTYRAIEVVDIGFAPVYLHTFKLTDDRYPDVFIGSNGNGIRYVPSDGAGGYQPVIQFATGERPRIHRPIDLNGDGHKDIVATTYRGFPSLVVLLNDGDGGLVETQGLNFQYSPDGVEFLDLDHDGDLDIVALSTSAGRIDEYLNQGDMVFVQGQQFVLANDSPRRLNVLDLDNDGLQELVVAYGGALVFDVFEIRPLGGLEFSQEFPVTEAVHDFELNDIDNDGDIDFFCIINNGYAVVLNNGDGTLSDMTGIHEDGISRFVARLGDLNQDGFDDVVFDQFRGRRLEVLINDQAGGFERVMDLTDPGEGFGVDIVDLDSDGDQDVIAVVASGRYLLIHRNEFFYEACPSDLNSDGELNFFDIAAYIQFFNDQSPAADFVVDGMFNFFDVSAFLSSYNSGCP